MAAEDARLVYTVAIRRMKAYNGKSASWLFIKTEKYSGLFV